MVKKTISGTAIEMKAVDLRKAINKLKSQFDFDN